MTRPASPVRAVLAPDLEAPIIDAVAARSVPPLDPVLRHDLVALLADALVLRFRERTSVMGASPRGHAHDEPAESVVQIHLGRARRA